MNCYHGDLQRNLLTKDTLGQATYSGPTNPNSLGPEPIQIGLEKVMTTVTAFRRDDHYPNTA